MYNLSKDNYWDKFTFQTEYGTSDTIILDWFQFMFHIYLRQMVAWVYMSSRCNRWPEFGKLQGSSFHHLGMPWYQMVMLNQSHDHTSFTFYSFDSKWAYDTIRNNYRVNCAFKQSCVLLFRKILLFSDLHREQSRDWIPKATNLVSLHVSKKIMDVSNC